MKNIILVVLFICFLGEVKAQNLNEYKYVIVPESFNFSKDPNQYQLNALTKFLFEKYGFETVMSKEQKPADLRNDPCLGLEADVKKNSGLFVTKLVVVLEDCYGNIVFESKEGRSRKKDFKAARHEALRDAFSSVEALNYEYQADPIVETTEDAGEEPTPVKEPEVATEAPEESKKEEMAESEIREAGENIYLTETPKNATENTYTRNNASFNLRKNEDGFGFFRTGMDEPFAMLITSEKKGNYIYNSLSRQGMAYFDASGNLIVEYFDREENRTVRNVYELEE